MRATHLPSRPLRPLILAEVRRYTGPMEHALSSLAGRAGVSLRCLKRIVYDRADIHYVSADRICAALHVHPSLVWTKDWQRVHESGAA